MDIIFYHPTFDTQWWIEALRKAIPQARVRAWKSGDNDSADYALVWHPPVEMLAGRDLKAVFALGAGVDSILSKLQAHPEMLNPSVPLFRLEDTGMGEQMQEYAVSQVLHWFRRFDDYRIQQNSSHWQPLPEYHREDFTIGILGAGVLGSKVAQSLQTWRFPLRCWSRTRKSWPGVQSFAGREELSAFLSQCRVLINLLPNTPETVGIINQQEDAGLDIASPEHQVLMNVTAKSEVAPSIIKENLSLHLTHTVKWTESLDTFLNMPTPVAFLEISNKPYLGNMLNDFAGVDQQRVMHCRKAFSDAKVFK